MTQRDVSADDRRALRIAEVRGVENRRQRVGEDALAAAPSAAAAHACSAATERDAALALTNAVQPQFFSARRIHAIAAAFPFDDAIRRASCLANAGHCREQRVLERVERFAVAGRQLGSRSFCIQAAILAP